MNQVVDLYRKYLADTGQQDDSTDYAVTEKLGQWASQQNPKVFDAFPDFAEQYGQIREANAPSLAGEFGRSLKSGVDGLGATAAGFGSLLTGSDYLKDKAAELEKDAAEAAPTIPTSTDIAPGRHGIGTLFTKDAARYAVSKLGGALPSLAEMAGTAAAGSLIGSAVEPGVGTVAGAAEGAVEGLLGRGIIKTAIKRILAGAAKDEGGEVAAALANRGITTEAAFADAVRAGDTPLTNLVTQTAKAISGSRTGEAVNLANIYGMTAGGIYNETGNRDVALGVGALGTLPFAIPGASLGGQVVKQLFPGLSGEAASSAAADLVGKRAKDLLHKAGVAGHAVGAGTAGIVTMEAANIVAKNLNEGRDALDITDADIKRLKEAAISGVIASAPFGALAFTGKSRPSNLPPAPPSAEARPTRPTLAPLLSNPLSGLSEAPPDTSGVVTPVDIARSDNAGDLLAQQQETIAKAQQAPPIVSDEQARQTALALAGETPETIAARELQQKAFGMAGAEVPDASNPDQVAQREAEAAGRAMAGNVPPELATPVPPIPENNILPPPASTAETYEQAKIREISDAVKIPGIRYQYSVFPAEMALPGQARPIQIDIIGPDGAPLGSTNLDQLAALGVKLPPVPDSLAMGKYSPEQVTLAQLPANIAANVAGGLPPEAPAAQPGAAQLPAGIAGLTEAAPRVPGAEIVAPETPNVQKVYDFQGRTKTIPADQAPPNNMVTADQWNELKGIRKTKPDVFKKQFISTLNDNARLAKAVKKNATSREATSAAGGKRLGFGSRSDGGTDIIDVIQQLGGVPRPGDNRGGDFDGFEDIFQGTKRLLVGKSRGGMDTFIQEIALGHPQFAHLEGQGIHALDAEINRALSERATLKKSDTKNARDANFAEAAFEGKGRGVAHKAGDPVNSDDLAGGAKMEIKGQDFVVTDIREDGTVVLQDGPRYGTQEVPPGTLIYPDKDTLENRAPGEPVFLPDEQIDKPVAPPAPVPDATVPKATAPAAPTPFQFGAVIESAPTLDFRQTELAQNLTPDQWVDAVRANLDQGTPGSRESSKADTRIALALQSPDGRVILTGITVPGRTLDVEGKNIIKEPTLQRMGINVAARRGISAGGNKPALLRDVVRAGYKPLAILHFTGEPGKIHQVFSSPAEFDSAWGVSEKTQGRNVQPTKLRGAVPRALRRQEEIEKAIDQKAEELLRADDKDRPRIIEEYRALDAELRKVINENQDFTGDTRPPEYRRSVPSAVAIEATKTAQFQQVMANLQQAGGNIQLMSKELLAQSTTQILQQRIAALQKEAAMAEDPLVFRELQRRIGVLDERMQTVAEAKGVTYSPWHIALAMKDIGNATIEEFVTLLHEAAEALTMRLTVEQRGAVRSAVNQALEAIRARGAAASEETGVARARESSATDLLAETLAQELTAKGIPEAPSLAQAIIRWVKDAYYRTAMALQAAFGADPSPSLALDWYENQLRREVFGDYNYEFSNLIERYTPSPLKEQVRRFTGRTATPGGIPDFLDPVGGIVRQPQVETLDRGALAWNMEFQLPGRPGAELDIPDPEARARIKGGVLNGLSEFYDRLRQEIAPDMDPGEFFQAIKRTAEEDPKLLLADLNQRIAESGTARIGGERMTEPMNREAQVELWGRFRKLGLSLRRQWARAGQSIADASKQFSDVAQDVNKLEGDLRNAALHEDRLRTRAKELVRELVSSINRGRSTAHTQGALAESIRETERLSEEDPIPQHYQNVLKSLSDGTTPIFDYVRAIAELDLPLNEMSNREVVKAIVGGADHNEALARLAANKPLAVTLATLARKNADQVDQIQLGWLRDTSKFREINDKLEEIKGATSSQLRELSKQIDERGKAAGLAARLQASYTAKRRRQQAASDRIARGEERQALIEKALPVVDKTTADTAQAAGGAQFEWAPEEGAVWAAMRQDAEGNWRRHERVLRFNPDGSAVDGDQLRQDISANLQWLRQRSDQQGRPRYNQIAAQTYALQLLDARGQQQRTWDSGILNAVDRFVRTPIASARSLGGPAMQRVVQMLNRYQFILRNYGRTLEAPAAQWQHEFVQARDAAGLKDNGEFIDQVYRPAMYFLAVNPGLEEGPAIRKAVALARRALPAPREDFNEKFTQFIRRTKEAENKLLGIAEQYGVFVDDKRLGGELRRAVPKGYLTGMRSLNGGMVDVVTKDMQRAGWKLAFTETNKDGKMVKTNPRAVTFAALDPKNAGDPQESEAIYATLGNAEALQPLLARLFTPGIIGHWLEPFIRKPGQEPFSYQGEPIPQSLVQDAWEKSGGDVLRWIDRLGETMDAQPDDAGHDAAALFRLAMFRNLDQLFGHEAKLAYDASQTPGLLDPHGAKPHALMDARVSDLLPPEHVDFATYEPENIHRLLARVAYHGAFGRNAKNIQAAFRENMNYLKGRQSEFQTLASLHTSAAGRAAEAAARGWNYDELRTADKRYQELKDFQSQLESVLGVSANSGPLGDFHKAMSLMNFVVGQIVDNLKTAAYNIISPAMRPFAQRSLGPRTITNTAKIYADLLQTGLGSLFQSFGLHLFKAGRFADTIGNAESRAFSNLPVSVVLSDIGHAGDDQAGLNKWMVKPLKIARNLQRKGLQVGAGEATEFPRLAVVPGLGVINSISNIEVQAGGACLAREFEQLVRDGIDYMAQHPDAANNPSFQFKPSDLYRFKLDHPLFDWWKQKTVEYNLGNIEDVVREASKRQAEDPRQRLLTDDQAITLSMINQNEFSGNSSINTTPAWLMTNSFLRMTMPLLRWPLWMMSAVHEAAKPVAGQNAVRPMLRALGTLALWNLPIGIAFSLLMDEYDKKLVGRKSNLPNVSGYSAIPLVGLPLGLATAEHPLSELEALLVRSARAGNIYGLGGDVAAQTIAGLDPSTGQRAVSLDQRVLVMSQLLNLQQAWTNYRNQGYADWGSVARPVLMSVGGNGVLHSVDITNHLLGLDNAQSRLVKRAASANWIRSAAQELDIDVRKGSFAGTPTPMSAHTREMYLAALANDRADFLEQYRLALNAAREKVADDPTVPGPDREREAQNRVLASWTSRSPMAALAAKPTPLQVQRLLGIMDPDGQQSVREALQRYDTFSKMIQPSPFEKYFRRQMQAAQPPSAESLRRRMAGGMMFSTR